MITWLLPLLTAVIGPQLADAERQLGEFDYPGAAATLEAAKTVDGRSFDENAKLYEMLGIAYASAGRTDLAEEAFLMLATIAPQRAIRYTLSPKVTFAFERARERAIIAGSPTLQLLWPPSADANKPVEVGVEVIANPMSMMRDGVLIAQRGESPPERLQLRLAPIGNRATVVVPPPATPSAQEGVLRLYLVALDAKNNEVAQVGSPAQPRQVALTYERPRRWYEHVWVWAIAGVALAAIAGGTAYALTHEESPRVPIDVTVN